MLMSLTSKASIKVFALFVMIKFQDANSCLQYWILLSEDEDVNILIIFCA